VISIPATIANTFAKSSSVGVTSPSRSGVFTAITRLLSVMNFVPISFTSASVINGRYFCCISYSNSIPGIGSPVKKFRIYSLAYLPDSDLSLSSYARSILRIICVCPRSSSEWVNPNCLTRSASTNSVLSPSVIPSSLTAALNA